LLEVLPCPFVKLSIFFWKLCWFRKSNEYLSAFPASTVLTLIELKDGTLATGSADTTIKLWDRNGFCLKIFTGHKGSVLTLIELKDGNLASGSYDNTIKLWNRKGSCLKTFKGHKDLVRTPEGSFFTPSVLTLIELKDGTLASGSGDHTIKLWNQRGSCLKTFKGHTGRIYSLIELQNGTLVSRSADKTIKLWDRKGSCLKTLTGHTTLIELKNGTLASGSNDNTIKLWDLKGSSCIQTLTGHKFCSYPYWAQERHIGQLLSR